MKKYYIDDGKKGCFSFFILKKYIFNTGNILYIIPEKLSGRFIRKSNCENICEKVSTDFREKIYYKTIINVIKENNSNDIIIDLINPLDNLELLSNLLKREIMFTLTESIYAHTVADYFLENCGIPVPIVSSINNKLYFFEENKNILCPANTTKINLSKNTYYLKNIDFPIKIDSLAILVGAMNLVHADFSDIIIKPCIICQ